MRKKENEFVDYQSAAFAKKRAQDQLEKKKKAFKVAIFAQIAVFAFPVIFAPLCEDGTFYGIGAGFLCSLVAYCMAGGLGWLVQLVIRIGHICWFIIPIFPIDLCALFIGIVMTGAMILLFPIITMSVLYFITKYDLKKADEYLNFCANNQQ